MAKTEKTATLGAGSIFEVSYDNGGTFERVPGMTAIGSIGGQSEPLETTAIDEKARTYISGLESPDAKTMTGNFRPENEAQKRFYEAGRNRESVVIRVTFPTEQLTVCQFGVALLGFNINEPTPDAALQFTVNGQQSGEVDMFYREKLSVTGIDVPATKTVKMGVTTETVGASVVPANATYQGIRYFAVDTTIAKIEADSGKITPLAVGDTDVYAITEDGDYQGVQALKITAASS